MQVLKDRDSAGVIGEASLSQSIEKWGSMEVLQRGLKLWLCQVAQGFSCIVDVQDSLF